MAEGLHVIDSGRTEETAAGPAPAGLETIDERLRSWPAPGDRATVRPAQSPIGVRRTELSAKTALVTGGSRGLGFAVAHELIAAGMHSVAICARDERGLERARADLARAGGRVLAVRADVTDRRQVEKLLEVVVGALGRLDVLVNGVGAMPAVAGAPKTTADAGEAAGIALWAPLYVALAARPVMRSQGGGRIVNIGAFRPRRGDAVQSLATGSALAMLQFSWALRAELARDGIVMTTVCPRAGRPCRPGRDGLSAERHGKTGSHAGEFEPGHSDSVRWIAQQIVRSCRNGETGPGHRPAARAVLAVASALAGHLIRLTAGVASGRRRPLTGNVTDLRTGSP